MRIRELLEFASVGATNAASVGTVVSPHLAIGGARGNKSYTGSPGKSGTKAPKPPKVKQAKNADGTAKNALDMKGTNIFGGAIKRLSESEIAELFEASVYDEVPSKGNWDIRVSKKPIVMPKITGNKAQYVAAINHSKRNITIFGTGDSREAAIENGMEKTTDDGGRTADPDQFKSFTADLNVDFTNDLHNDPDATPFFRFVKHNGKPFLVRASEEYYKAFGKEIEQLGFRKATGRLSRIGNATQIYGFPISRNTIKSLGFVPNGRYVLSQENDDEDGNTLFSMTYDSRSLGPQDKFRMGKPGITISGTLAE
jgi:hypothetical protein